MPCDSYRILGDPPARRAPAPPAPLEPAELAAQVELRRAMIAGFVARCRGADLFVELGAGPGLIARAAATAFRRVVGLDDEIDAAHAAGPVPPNVAFRRIASGVSAPISALCAWHSLARHPDPHATLAPLLTRLSPGGVFFGQTALFTPERVFEAPYVFYGEAALIRLAAAHGLVPALLERDEANQFLAFCFVKPAPPRSPVLASLGVVMPEPQVGAGGPRKILQACDAFARSGVRLTLYIDSPLDPATLRERIRRHFHDFPCDIHIFRDTVDAHDAILVTQWSTAYRLRNLPDPNRVAYFVQDYEPLFEAMGSNHLRAQATYALGFRIVCYGAWVAERLRREFGLAPAVIPFSVDRAIYAMKPARSPSLDLLFFARPSQPRRCFELGIEGLRLLHQRDSRLRIGLFGEAEYGDLGFPYEGFGLIGDRSELAALYATARLGLCFSTTNPSLVGYEMIASGLPIVDVSTPGCEVNFGGGSFVHYCQPTPDSIATTILDALADEPGRIRRRDAGVRYIDMLPPEAAFGPSVVEAVCSELKARLP